MPKFGRKFYISMVCAFSLALTSCATVGRDGKPLSALDRSINQCIGSVVAGALLGALIGAATNHKAGQGALIGAGVGTVACAVFVAMNNAQDKERVQQSQIDAARTGRTQSSSYIGSDGQVRTLQTTSEPVLVPAAMSSPSAANDGPVFTACRQTHTLISVGNTGAAPLGPQMVCRTPQGNYVTVNSGTDT